MTHRIKKAAVLGSGVMGSGIACHLANAGLEVIMLDIVPFDLDEKQKSIKAFRNRIADTSLANALKSKPAPLYDIEFASRITTGNFDDDFDKISSCDWIIEVVIEKLEIKRQIFEKVDLLRKPASLVTSNTSGIPISQLAEGRSDDFKRNFCGTHFFNPARYMALFEVIPHAGTDADVINFWMTYAEVHLGKKAVLCKDTPAFIANRIGFYSGNKVGELTEKYGLTIEEVDKITGEPIGWPNTGSYRLLDLVGLDTSVKVTQGVIDNCPQDEYVKVLKNRSVPKATQFLLDNKFLGDKSGQGFYKKTDQRDDKGGRVILALDLNTLEYNPAQKPMIPVVGIAKKVELMDKRLKDMMASDEKSGHFVRDLLAGMMVYAANRIPEISDNIYSLDNAMKAGYAWSYGPFEYWDMIGIKETIALAEQIGEKTPAWIRSAAEKGLTSFYKSEGGKKKYYDLQSESYKVIPGTESNIHLDNFRSNTPVYKNSECIIHDIGDGVLCFEFISKSNAIGDGIGQGAIEALNIAQSGDWAGIVIGNNAKNFTVGANLMNVAMVAMQKDFAKLEEMVHGFQQINMAMRYAPVPVVTATQGYVFGGGCEILMHTDAAICHAESYIGLVEVGVGLIPGGGGTKEFAVRASESFFEGDVQIPTLIEKLKTIATASVATSAYEGYKYGYLQHDRDYVEINLGNVLSRAKDKVLDLAKNYTAPVPKNVTVLGRGGLGTLYTALNEFYLGKYMSEYDLEIAKKVAYVLCGGDLTGQQKVSEQYLLDIEREAFLQLLGNQKTLDRIQYLLMNNKPLRN
ncbi:MAG: 3-hydroxyacyl-CoA dehydrogenase/enoyl-CoA hydratase family protein [Saprospiraceae bacterium]|jgi:3-hydroxyacyl-CoA dehydrogenase|nr:3-hydroxyacyl-CoA dehydrogenase/enoyl-CoA hydratase family protein [Saprospiraceae bacterium]